MAVDRRRVARDGVPVEVAAIRERRLGRRGKGLLVILIAFTAILATSVPIAVWRKRIEERKQQETLAVLMEVRALVEFNLRPPHEDPFGWFEGVAGPVTTDEPDDETGQVQLRRESSRDTMLCEWHSGIPPEEWFLEREQKTLPLNASCRMILMPRGSIPRYPGRQIVVDAWGRPIQYRHPGVVRQHGWDLYSLGPNGIDERGQGDDVLVGEDVAPLGSGK